MILHLTNINSKNLESDIILNKNLTNISPSNMYEILFDSESFDEIFNIVLQKLKEFTNQNFDTYVKNIWGYIQNDDDFKLFSFKNEFDSERFLSTIEKDGSKKNFIIARDVSSAQKKYLYSLLEESGINKKFLYTSYTTYPR